MISPTLVRTSLAFALLTVEVLPVSALGKNDPAKLVAIGVERLLEIEEEGGCWPYEGVYRVGGEIPVGYRVGGTALALEALLAADPENPKVAAAIKRGVDFVLKGLEDPRMKPSREDRYDVRVWGHCYALSTLCLLRKAGFETGREDAIKEWVPKLIEALLAEQLDDGGWNYATRRAHASFVTAPVVQALLRARDLGEEVAASVFEKAKKALLSSRAKGGGYSYSGSVGSGRRADRTTVPGSIARAPVSEVTLALLGMKNSGALEASIQNFYVHWEELEKRRKKTGTHVPPYGIAPYYFYYGHRYLGQAIEMLPESRRGKHRKRLLRLLLKTKDPDGTWNDRVFARSRNFGTTMAILGLLSSSEGKVPKLGKRRG